MHGMIRRFIMWKLIIEDNNGKRDPVTMDNIPDQIIDMITNNGTVVFLDDTDTFKVAKSGNYTTTMHKYTTDNGEGVR
jgi:hypothetical protein